MIGRPHSLFPRLREAAEKCVPRARPFAADVYRFVVLETPADVIYLSLEGSRFGGRLNAPQGFTVLYASLDEVTARAEARRVERRYSIPGRAGSRRKVVAFGVDVELVLDLNDVDVQRALGISSESVVAEDWEALFVPK